MSYVKHLDWVTCGSDRVVGGMGWREVGVDIGPKVTFILSELHATDDGF